LKKKRRSLPPQITAWEKPSKVDQLDKPMFGRKKKFKARPFNKNR